MAIQKLNPLDASNMHDVLTKFPAQVSDGVALGRALGAVPFPANCRHVVVLGMGGSAIGGDLLRTYFSAIKREKPVIFSVNRNYDLPSVLSRDDMVIASSYSGNTEETLSAFKQAVKHTKNIVVISSGGELTMQARAYSLPLIRLPEGYQPRCAVGYSFFPLVTALSTPENIGEEAAEETEEGIRETIALLKKKSAIYKFADAKKNPTFALAKKLAGTIPVIYAPSDPLEAVGLRWRNQFHENGKQIAFGNVLPEMNHNEIESWLNPKKLSKKFSLLFLRDDSEHERVSVRFDALRELVGKRTGPIEEIRSEGDSLLARMFSLLYFGDWVSYWLALENGVDPTVIPSISALKKILAKP